MRSPSLNYLTALRPILRSNNVRGIQSQLYSTTADRLAGLDQPTVWHEFSPLANKYGSINLGQGFPDWNPPDFVVESMVNSVMNGGVSVNQYARSQAHMPLAQVLSEDYSARLNVDIDPATMVVTAVGVTNVMYCAMQGLVNPGDEVILMEPAFDIYLSQVKMAGGVPVYVPLRPVEGATDANSKFQLDMSELEAAITKKTKIIIINTPHNPTGKMFTREELQLIANIINKNDHVIVISDEVYEHIVFDKENSPHISFASLPDMFERTLTFSSSGKTFSATGWKCGWAVGPANLVRCIQAVQQWVNFSAPTPNQDAIAQCLRKAKDPYQDHSSYYEYLASDYLRKRGLLASALESAGIKPVLPPGGFFIIGDTSSIDFPERYMKEVTEASPNPMPRDWAMSRWMTQEVGVTAIPPSAFYGDGTRHLAENILRFAFCKSDETIMEAQKRFEKYFIQK